VWTTDKDGLIAGLLAGEMTARLGKDPAEIYTGLTSQLGSPCYARIDAPADSRQKKILASMQPADVQARELAGEPIERILTAAPGNGKSIGGLKLETAGGWCAARPSGTENVYKIYAESFRGEDHLKRLVQEAQEIVADAFRAAGMG